MWQIILDAFESKPSQLKVVKLFLEYGIRVDTIGIFCGSIEQSTTKLAKAIAVDRKVVDLTAATIRDNKELFKVFKYLKPIADISDIARYDKESSQGVIDIHAFSDAIGIAALATRLLAEEEISIRYIVARDPKLSVENVMTIVTDKRPSGRVVEILLRNKDIIKVSLS